MDTKLTLKLDKAIIERAKEYARKKNTSLSYLIETYLDFLTTSKVEEQEITPLVKSLSGIVDPAKAGEHTKKNYKNHILKKYSK